MTATPDDLIETDEADPAEVARMVRDLSLAFLEFGGSFQESWDEHNADPTMTQDLWYERRCLLVSQLVHHMAVDCGFAVSLVLGMFQDPTDAEPLRHAWLELPDGTIIDPTSAQMGLSQCAVIAPGDERHGYYHSRDSWAEGAEP